MSIRFISASVLALVVLALPSAAQTVLFDGGPPANSIGTGVGGADESIIQTSLGNMMIGAQCDPTGNSSVMDDFTVTAPSGWLIQSITVYCYETLGGVPSTINDVRLQIWDGDPASPNSQVVFGDLSTNRLVSSTWSNAFRVDEATSGINSDRAIMENVVKVATAFKPGTYWFQFQASGTAAAEPFAPPLVITGQPTTGNAQRIIFNGPVIIMSDNGNPQGLPFRIEGSVVGITNFCTAKTGLACGTPSIAASGIASATTGSGFTVSAGPARTCKSGILVYNTAQTGGIPFQGGTLCVEPMGLRRAGSTNSMGTPGGANCDGVFTIDMNAFAVSGWVVPNCDGTPSTLPANNAAAFLTVPGTGIFSQWWGRDSVATGSFVSDGVSWTVGP